MSIWAYKVISSGKGGFATPALLESFLNQLGAEEWEIIHFQTQPDNSLAFSGLARRPTQRDWTLEDAAASAAKAEVEKLRAEFEAKFKGTGAGPGAAAEETAPGAASEAAAADDGLRKLRDTESDLDPDAPDENAEPDDWDKLTNEDDLPTFFEAIQPLMRRNQRGPGLSAGVDHLAKKWGMSEEDIVGALKECGFTIPTDENAKPDCLEYDGDLYWVNVNRRGELWINTKEKPRAVFRTVQGERAPAEASAKEGPTPVSDAPDTETPGGAPAPLQPAANAQPALPGASRGGKAPVELPTGPALLEKVRPLMRRNRRGSGGSGSLSFLSRALKCTEADLAAAFGTLDLALAVGADAKPIVVKIGAEDWWLNRDSRGGIWINGQEAGTAPESDQAPKGASGETAAASASGTAVASPGSDHASGLPPAAGQNPALQSPEAGRPTEAPRSDSVLTAVRLLLKPTKTGSHSAETGRLAETLGKSREDLLAALVAAGLRVPGKPREKPLFVEQNGEIFWLNLNTKDELWLNAKASKFAAGNAEEGTGEAKGEKKPRRTKPKA